MVIIAGWQIFKNIVGLEVRTIVYGKFVWQGAAFGVDNDFAIGIAVAQRHVLRRNVVDFELVGLRYSDIVIIRSTLIFVGDDNIIHVRCKFGDYLTRQEVTEIIVAVDTVSVFIGRSTAIYSN